MGELTAGEVWTAVILLLIAEAAIFAMILHNVMTAARDAVNDSRRRARREAEQIAEQEAQRRVREILRTVEFRLPVALINESDIDWGEGRKR